MNHQQAITFVLENLRIRKAVGAPDTGATRAVMERLFETPAPDSAKPEKLSFKDRIFPESARVQEKPVPAPLPVPATTPAIVFAPRAPSPVANPQPATSKAERLAALRAQVVQCVKCSHLANSRHQVVFGVGNPEAELMFVGEAPGAEEDLQGEPFVGKAGQLLTKIIIAMGLKRELVYIANVLKCRPDVPPGTPGNRPPRADEMQVCLPYLLEQIQIIRPKVIVALGKTAMTGLFPGGEIAISRVRGIWREFEGTPVMPTFHPSFLLRSDSEAETMANKRKVWEDMLAVKERLGLPISAKDRTHFLPKR